MPSITKLAHLIESLDAIQNDETREATRKGKSGFLLMWCFVVKVSLVISSRLVPFSENKNNDSFGTKISSDIATDSLSNSLSQLKWLIIKVKTFDQPYYWGLA